MRQEKRKIDLHVHTCCSDGEYAPAEVIRMAYEQRVDTIAVTDHDTVSGLEKAMAEGGKLGVEVIPGIEISARNGFTMHILGYFPGKTCQEIASIEDSLNGVRKGRTLRTYQQMDLLNRNGYDISKEDVKQHVKGAFTSKVHLVKAMLKKGFIDKNEEGIKLLESDGYDIPYGEWVMKPEEAVSLINSYNGIAVLAHPGKIKEYSEELIKKLARSGLKGVEVYSRSHSMEQVRHFEHVAQKYGLLRTYGTDFHNNGRKMGQLEGIDIDHHEILNGLKKRGAKKWTSEIL